MIKGSLLGLAADSPQLRPCMWPLVTEIPSRVPSLLRSSVLSLSIFSPHNYLSGTIVMVFPSQCLDFKMFLKARLIWGARELLKVSQYVPLFILFIHLFVMSILMDCCSLSALEMKSA